LFDTIKPNEKFMLGGWWGEWWRVDWFFCFYWIFRLMRKIPKT